jgi:hypothetical protein
MWRIYMDNEEDRLSLLVQGLVLRGRRKVARFLLLSLWCLVVFVQDYMDFVNEGEFACHAKLNPARKGQTNLS